MVAQIAVLSVLLTASHHNYPGGVALERLVDAHLRQQLAVREVDLRTAVENGRYADVRKILRPIFVHIDVAAATTGVTRYLAVSFVQISVALLTVKLTCCQVWAGEADCGWDCEQQAWYCTCCCHR